jgi:hypothetical protein
MSTVWTKRGDTPYTSMSQENLLCDHIGPWCARCLGYLEPHEIGAYHPYGRLPSVDDPWLQVALEKVLGWTVPVHRRGCPSEGVPLDAVTASGRLNSLLLCGTGELENVANTLFYRGNLNLNMAIRLALSHRYLNEGNEEEAAIQLAKATISNGGSSQSEVVGPILDLHMPPVLNDLPYQKIRVLLALGNRARNIGDPDLAEKEYYGQARYILSNLSPKKTKKARHALERRELSVRQRCASLDEAKGLIKDAVDDAEQYGVLTTRNYIGLDNFRKNEYVQAEDNFREMEMEMLFEAQNPNAIVSWWHKMAGWLGLGATVYANDPKRRFEEALRYCLMSEYVSAMLGLQVDVTRGISEQLLGPPTLLSPSAVVRKIGKEKNIAKEKMEEIRRTALIESRLQKDLLAELRVDNRNLKVQTRPTEREIREDQAEIIDYETERKKRQLDKQCEMQEAHVQATGKEVMIVDLGSNVIKYNKLEREPFVGHEVEAARSQLEKKLRDSAEKFISSSNIPDEKKIDVLNKIASHTVDIFEACQNRLPFEEALKRKVKTLQPKKGEIFWYQPKSEEVVQAPDLSKIPLWQGRKRGGMPLDYLKTHYGQYLSAFGAEQNSVFQDQIRAHDPKLVQGVSNQLSEEGKGRKVSDFVKPRSARTERELDTFDLATLKQAHRIKGLLRRGWLKKAELDTFDLATLKQAHRIKGLLRRRRLKEADTKG